MRENIGKAVDGMKSGKYEIDERRTEELNLPELLVIAGRGDKDHFCCILEPSKARPGCPRCGNLVIRNQGKMHRNYLDVIPRGDDAAVVTVTLEFIKNRCAAANCRHVYYPEYSFAAPYARTTRRLEDAIVRMVLQEGYSFTKAAEMLEGKLSRQVVGQIYHRRLEELIADQSEDVAWFRKLLEEMPLLFYNGVLSRRRRRL